MRVRHVSKAMCHHGLILWGCLNSSQVTYPSRKSLPSQFPPPGWETELANCYELWGWLHRVPPKDPADSQLHPAHTPWPESALEA